MKTSQVKLLVDKCNNDLRTLLINFNSDISKIKNFVPPSIKINNARKALMIGINYTGSKYNLEGCLNDVENISNKLANSYGFGNIIKMTDNTATKPTRDNILSEFKNLLVNSNKGDLLYFHYSGHGGYVKDTDNDETDKYDELIYPIDMKTITDDELKQLIMTFLKDGVTLFVMFDSCHSGTMLDLKYQYLDSSNYNNYNENNVNLETAGNVFMISGCTDSQTSADAYINKTAQGATSWSFLSTLNSNPNCTWRELLQNMRNLIKTSKYTQIPQLSTGKIEDIDKKVFL
jgi:hypothetical protein